jgi:hypothetical protein
MTNMYSFLKKPQGLLALSLILILLGSFFAGMFNTSLYSVKVKEIQFKADHGTLSGLLYMPEGAGANDPRPVIVTTHGYLNTKEMQDAPAIEMSRRGYIVLALDQYDHGDSRWTIDTPVKDIFFTFWVYSQFDAVKYMYQQDYTKKDDKGNGYIAVSGHSMGGFSTAMAMYHDEMNALQTGYRMIHAGISVGSDYSFTSYIVPQDQIQAAFGSRTVGMVAGHYDEFFFSKSDAEKTAEEKKVTGSVTHKDFPTTISGKSFLGLPADAPSGESGKFYQAKTADLLVKEKAVRPSETGERVIYTPNETHPWNHFSTTTTASLIDFYAHAFKDVAPSGALGSGNQIWWLKEAGNFVALIGFFLMIVPLISLLLKVPFLRKSVSESAATVSAPSTGRQKTIYWAAFAFSSLIPAILFATLMDKKPGGLNVLSVIAIVLLVVSAAAAIFGFIGANAKKDNPAASAKLKNAGIGGTLLAVVSLAMLLVFKNAAHIFPLSPFFNEPTTNQIVYWAVVSALITAFVTFAFHYFSKKDAGTKFSSYGISLNPVTIIASLCTAIAAVAIGYLVLFVVQAIFGTDFRIWVFAVRTFDWAHLVVSLRYIPFFLIYYFVSTMALNANTRGQKGGYTLAILLNVGGLVLWLIAQYGLDFASGVAFYPGQALNGILLFALVLILILAAVYARKLFEKTNNVWLAAFLNTILFTIIAAVNTVMYWHLI